jgi:hypothetical protein
MDIRLLEINYRYGQGWLKEHTENEIRSLIQSLSLEIIEKPNKRSKDIRDKLYKILGNKPILILVK